MDNKKVYIFTDNSDYSKMIFKELKNKKNIVLNHGADKEKKSLFNTIKKLSLSKKIGKIFNFPFRKILYRSFFKNLEITEKSEDICIFFDSYEYAKKIIFIKWLKKEYPKMKLYLWNWNTLKDKTDILEFKKVYDKVCTFDKNDAKKYGLEYFPQFFSKEIGREYENKKKPSNGVVFVGADKGRVDYLEKIAIKLKNMHIPVHFHILKDEGVDYSKERVINDYITDKKLNYDEVIKMTATSAVVLDLAKVGQDGFSLRVMESIFMGKKLITKDQNIKKFDFYNPNNILVIEDIDDIKIEFFRTPYEKLDEEILNKYNVNSWLKYMIGLE